MNEPVPDDLVDALARGRLTLAELAGMTEREVDALYMLALGRLDTQRDDDARRVLAGLLTLFPYRALYWHAYGVALHRLGLYQNARRAYDAALLLDPERSATRRNRDEVVMLLGQGEHATAADTAPLTEDEVTFTLASGVRLPLAQSHRTETVEPTHTAITQTAAALLPPAPTPRTPESRTETRDDVAEHTHTAIVRRRRREPLAEEP